MTVRQKKSPLFIPINDDYRIDIDNYNWMVVWMREVKDEESENYGERYDVIIGFYPNLSRALEGLIQDMTRKGEGDTSSLKAYLAWYETTLHSLGDRVLRQRELLQEALELNKVM